MSLRATVAPSVRELGLIAGNGKFPLIFAEQAKEEGSRFVPLPHRGETSEEIEDLVASVTWVYVGELGKIIRTFRRAHIAQAVMAGGIKKVKLFSNFRPDVRGVAFLARLKSREDDQLLRGVAAELESEGIEVLESTLFLSRIIPTEGTISSREPTPEEWKDIRLGTRVAKTLGRLGVGQTVVVKAGVVLAVEAVEGTDLAIRRGGSLVKSGAVVVKMSKPQQDLRFDVPAVGVETLGVMREVGSRVLAVEAGRSILLEKERLIEAADRAGVAVVAVANEDS